MKYEHQPIYPIAKRHSPCVYGKEPPYFVRYSYRVVLKSRTYSMLLIFNHGILAGFYDLLKILQPYIVSHSLKLENLLLPRPNVDAKSNEVDVLIRYEE